MDASNDGSESVDQFLARIASLSSKQGQEEAERSKRVEEELLQARKERQARRAERARSLSPSKTGPSPSLRTIGDATPSRSRGIEPPVTLTPPSQSLSLDRSSSTSPKSEHRQPSSIEFTRPLPPQPFHDRSSTPSAPANATSLSRSGTLSWNQRPASRGAGSFRARPQSVASIPDAFTNLAATPQKAPEEMSRKDIAASLASKDPTWFRQTADRGVGSAAYRKDEFDQDTTTSLLNRGVRLPGMSKDSTMVASSEPQKPTPPPSPLKTVSTLPPQQRPDADQPTSARPASMMSLSSKSPVLDLPSFKPLELSNAAEGDSTGLGRTSSIPSSAGRPPSPTKGLGGFVQSAMMKRSDSVNKRWSVQANAGLKRGDSVATARPAQLSGVPGYTPSHSRNSSKDTRIVREGNSSPLSSSRPVSSHGSDPVPVTRGRPLPRPQDESASPTKDSPVSEQDANLPESPVRQLNRPTTPPPSEQLLSRSPSKTLDSRRWSPTKASWLESALNKPETPRLSPAKSETPAWKLNMQRSKEAQSQLPEGIRDLPKAADATKPLASPPLRQTSPVRNSSTDGMPSKPSNTSAGPTSEKDPSLKTPLKSLPLTSNLTDGSTGKPAIPSKRNITPVTSKVNSDGKPGGPANPATEPADEPTISSSKAVSSPEAKSEVKPPMLKPKPQTPPKTDFRASLKSRQMPSTANANAEPEFKAVFGKLKRTQTQNYVAPDVLKNNITQGKAALNATGGPQPSKRVDEFKESILQKKEAMKASGGSIGKRPESLNSTKPSEPVPEALAKRIALHKTGPSTDKIEVGKVVDDQPATPALSRNLPPKPNLLKEEDPVLQPSRIALPPKSLSEESISSKVVSTMGSENKSTTTLRKTNTNPESIKADKTAASSAEASFKVKLPDNSRLAARLNPALAGILSRSGSPRPTEETAHKTSILTNTHGTDGPSSKGTELTHATKSRAKGPKRRTPKGISVPKEGAISKEVNSATKSEPVPVKATPLPSPKPVVSSATPATITAAKNRETPEQFRGPKPTPRKPSANIELPKPAEGQDEKPPIALTEKSKAAPVERNTLEETPTEVEPKQPSIKPKPLLTAKSAERRTESKPSTLKALENESVGKPATPKKFAVLPDRPLNVASPPESDGEKHLPSISPPALSSLPLTPSKSKLNTPRSYPSPDDANKSTSVTPSKVRGLGLQIDSSSRKVAATPELTPPPDSETISSRPRPLPSKPKALQKSPSKVKTQLQTFFGIVPQIGEKADFDTQTFLASQNKPTQKAKTVSMQIWEVTGDGKRTPMPPQQEHILFEECMYLCVHAMQPSSGARVSETYLWCGDEVPEAAIEDAQLFCRKIARDNGAKLEVVKQGKESSEFFQALGGIVITRKNKSSALYMLCGRRHLGHVAFDEVEFTASSLCSGFPFLISAKFGKLYLWKGVGSDQEDVGCARLIGMDLGLTGEIEEISQGTEPASFWESFTSRAQNPFTSDVITSAEHSKGYSSRLYRVEHDRPKSSGGFWGLRAASPPKQSLKALVEEVSPFTQKDLDVNHIHILDTYSTVYVIIGSSAKKPAEFITALQIAQEIAVLCPSVQDRPLIPSCYVLLGEPPQEVKAVFRKWSPPRDSSGGSQVCVRLEEVAQELGLSL
ncbi:uncharacterized protein A1O9_10855 [Exophiala aquamarina CBS 119918]|uniref:Uncharacterized protein n=1 Tax=Exophiala aquamarina CBS 119918 TaxID=1182545 RepID=A0A072NYK8_9EURO|nr:uncharacterized protein A1O9_10855 [Exophiala aquamarina CBS 119918]KEF52949.1 hypothetical protein A1O9_10855 [Exophiala aquamarina CBS 119918]